MEYKDYPPIPDFLRRKTPRRGRGRSGSKSGTGKLKCILPDLAVPTGKLWAKAKTQRLHINDELPRIGSGVRQVLVRVGRKWVYVAEPGGGMQRVKRTVYDKIKKLL